MKSLGRHVMGQKIWRKVKNFRRLAGHSFVHLPGFQGSGKGREWFQRFSKKEVGASRRNRKEVAPHMLCCFEKHLGRVPGVAG